MKFLLSTFWRSADFFRNEINFASINFMIDASKNTFLSKQNMIFNMFYRSLQSITNLQSNWSISIFKIALMKRVMGLKFYKLYFPFIPISLRSNWLFIRFFGWKFQNCALSQFAEMRPIIRSQRCVLWQLKLQVLATFCCFSIHWHNLTFYRRGKRGHYMAD